MGIRSDREYHPPLEEHPESREFAPLGDEYNADAADPPRRAKKRLWTSYAIAAAVTVTLLCSTAISSGEESTAATIPPPSAEELETEPALVETTEPGQLLLTLARLWSGIPIGTTGARISGSTLKEMRAGSPTDSLSIGLSGRPQGISAASAR